MSSAVDPRLFKDEIAKNGKSVISYHDNDNEGEVEEEEEEKEFRHRHATGGDNASQSEESVTDDSHSEASDDQIPSVKELKVKFDVVGTKLINEGRSKYTVYIILVMEMSKLDTDQAVIERRYNEFHQLNKGLQKECPEVMKDVTFPKKRLFSKKFEGQTVEHRTRTFEKFLRYIYHQEGVTETKSFQDFFYRPHLKKATQLLKCESYEDSYEEYRLSQELQKKLGSNKESKITAMCGIVETSKKMKEYERAEMVGEECLNLMIYDVGDMFLLGLLQSVIDAKKRLRKPTEQLKATLKECLRKSKSDQESIESLRVLLVKKF